MENSTTTTTTVTQPDESYQRTKWIETKKNIKQLLQQLTPSNIKQTVLQLFQINLLRYQGLFIREIMKQQIRITTNTELYGSLISIINSKIPEIGELLINRLVLQFKKNYLQNNKNLINSSIIFICQLINQQVLNEILILQILQMLLESNVPNNNNNNNNNNIELAIMVLKQTGLYLFKHSNTALIMILNRLKDILQDGANANANGGNGGVGLSSWNRKSIEYILKLARNDFKNIPIIKNGLDLVETEDKETHVITLEDKLYSRDHLNVFSVDEEYLDHENEYIELKKEILGETDHENENENEIQVIETTKNYEEKITDMSQSELLQYQKTVYLTIMSSMSSDEAVHKLLKLNFKSKIKNKTKTKTKTNSNDNEILADMVIKCCSQEKTYLKYYGIIGEKLISRNDHWHNLFIKLFKYYYDIIENFETNSLRNLGKFFGHLFASDKLALDQAWSNIKLTEQDTNPAKRILLKFIFQEMIEELGINEVKERLINDDYLKPYIKGIFPVINVDGKDADAIRFSINFFTAIGLGVLTEEMRYVLDNLPEPEEEDDRGRSRSRSYSRSASGSSYNSRSRSYSRSQSRSSRSPNPRGRQRFKTKKHNHNESRTPSRENLKRKRSESVTDRNGNNNNNNNNLQDLLNNLK